MNNFNNTEANITKVKTLNINNYQFNYLEKGAGNPIILAHGSVSDYRTWYNQLNRFQSTHHVFAFSRRYHWPNEKIKTGQDYDMLQHVNDLKAFNQTVLSFFGSFNRV